MAKADIEANLIQPILDLMTTAKVFSEKTGKNSTKSPNRDAAEKVVGQFLVIDPQVVKDATSNAVNNTFDEAQLNAVLLEVYKIAQALDDRFKKDDEPRWKQMLPYKPSGNSYIISNYAAVRRLKDSWARHVITLYKKADLTAITTDVNTGHGGVGGGDPLSGIVAARGLAKLSKMASEASDAGIKEFLNQLVEKANVVGTAFRDNVKIQYHHTQIAESETEFKKDYNITLSLQSALGNNIDSHVEKKVLNTMRDLISAEMLANLPGSASLKEAVIGLLINNVVKTAGKSFKTKTKNKSSYKSSTKGTVTKTIVRKTFIPVNTLGAGRKITKPRNRVVAQPSFISLKALLDAKLPQEVKDRMSFPRLVNRTGRFASSVRVMSVDPTPSGAPSISYTYQKNPYDVFKHPGGRMGTPDRDPRALIETSIRAIASQAAIGRFYIRRV